MLWKKNLGVNAHLMNQKISTHACHGGQNNTSMHGCYVRIGGYFYGLVWKAEGTGVNSCDSCGSG